MRTFNDPDRSVERLLHDGSDAAEVADALDRFERHTLPVFERRGYSRIEAVMLYTMMGMNSALHQQLAMMAQPRPLHVFQMPPEDDDEWDDEDDDDDFTPAEVP